MADVSRSLAVYLASLRWRKWKPGALDCGIFMSDWMVSRGAPDPMADIRGTYDSERKFLRILRREGGFVNCCSARFGRIGMTETMSPKIGDLVAVTAPYAERGGKIKRRPTGAIAISENMRVVATPDMGIVVVTSDHLPTLKAWTWNGCSTWPSSS